MIIEEAVRTIIRARNQFASQDGISKSLSPLTIVTGAPPQDYNKMDLKFGTYVQVYNDNEPTNTMTPRTTGAIALSSIGNSKGDYSFMSLVTGQNLSRLQWTVLPMPSSVINQVTQLAKREGQSLLKEKCLLFEKRPGIPLPLDALYDEANLDLVFKDEGEYDLFDPSLKKERDVLILYDVSISLNELAAITNNAGDMSAALSFSDADDDSDNDDFSTATSQGANDHANAIENSDYSDTSPSSDPPPSQESGATIPSPEGAKLTTSEQGTTNTTSDVGADKPPDQDPTHSYNLLSQKVTLPVHQQFFQQSVYKMTNDPQNLHDHVVDFYEHITHHIINQMHANGGIRKHGQVAVDVLFKDFLQIDTKGVIKALKARELSSRKQKKSALRAINLIKEKRN